MIYALEGLRGIAAIIVALFHGWSSAATSLKIIRNGWLFVDLFFVISGFVMSHVYRNQLSTRSDVQSFVIKRLGRLYPLHFTMFFFFIACGFLLETLKLIALHFGHKIGVNPVHFDIPHPLAIVENLFLVQGIGLGPAGLNIPSWSISAEIWTYLVFVAVTFSFSQMPRRWIIVSLFLSILGLVACVFFGKGSLEIVYSGLSLFRCIYGFFLGTSLPVLKERIKPTYLFISIFQLLALFISVVIVIYADTNLWLTFLAPLAFTGLVFSASFDFGIIAKILQLKPFQTLGKLSYSIYMTHYSLLLFFDHAAEPLHEPYRSLLRVIYVAVLLGFSTLTYRWIEVPWRSRFHRYADWKRAPQTQAT